MSDGKALQGQLALVIDVPEEPEVIAAGTTVSADPAGEAAPAAMDAPTTEATTDVAASDTPTDQVGDAGSSEPQVKHTCGMCRQMIKKKESDEDGVCRRVFGKRVKVKTLACPQKDVDPELVKKYAPPPRRPKTTIPRPQDEGWEQYTRPEGPPATVIVARILPGEGEVQQRQTVVTIHEEGQMPTAWEQGPFTNLLTMVASIARQYFERASARQDEDEGATQPDEELTDQDDESESGEPAAAEEEES